LSPILAGVALAVVVGAVVAVSTRLARLGILGMAVVLVGTPLLADPVATPLALAARLVTAILATYVLWVAARTRPTLGLAVAPTEGSRIGWPADALVAAAAAIVGFGAHGLGVAGSGPALASAVGFAIGAVALIPLITGRDILRVGHGMLLLTTAALLVRTGLGGTPLELEQLLSGVLIVVLAGAIAALALGARLDGTGTSGFAFADEDRARPGSGRGRDAHRLDAR